jgi:hypothetical protein
MKTLDMHGAAGRNEVPLCAISRGYGLRPQPSNFGDALQQCYLTVTFIDRLPNPALHVRGRVVPSPTTAATPDLDQVT